MRNVLLSLFSAFFLFQAGTSSAQIVTENGRDTATGNYSGSGSDFKVYNRIKSGSSTPLTLKWTIISHNLANGTGWDMTTSGVCDNKLCYSYTTSDNPFANGKRYESFQYDDKSFEGNDHDFHVVFGTSNPTSGSSAYVRVYMEDAATSSARTLTFIATKNPTGVSTTTSYDDVVLYPNPATDAINVIYDPAAGVKTIAVYNLIGKLTGPIYKPANNGSAKLSLGDMPNGVYFMRLMDARGHVVATRRFTRQ